eukprot:10558799-Lingulodinium_polyedra.AAC.1
MPMRVPTPGSIGGSGAVFSAPPTPVGSTRPCTTAQAREPMEELGLPGRRSCAACAAAQCWTRRMTQCGRAA